MQSGNGVNPGFGGPEIYTTWGNVFLRKTIFNYKYKLGTKVIFIYNEKSPKIKKN